MSNSKIIITPEADVIEKIKNLQSVMRDPATQNNPIKLQALKKDYMDCVNQMATEIDAINRYLFSQLTQLENSKTVGKDVPETHTQLANASNQLTNFIKENILQNENVADRTLAMEFWAAVLKKSIDKGDLISMQTIYSVLQSSPEISRLKATKEGLSNQAKKFLASDALNKLVMADTSQMYNIVISGGADIIPNHAIFKQMLDRLGNSADAQTKKQQEEIVFILQQAKESQIERSKNFSPTSMTKLQQKLMDTSQKIVDQLPKSLSLEPRGGNGPSASLLKKNSNLRKVIMDNDQVSIKDNGAQDYLNNFIRKKQAEENLRQYISQYMPAEHQNNGEKQDLSKRRAIVLQEISSDLNQYKSDDEKCNYLKNVLEKNGNGKIKDISSLGKHHRNISGAIKALGNQDTQAIQIIKALYTSINDLNNQTKLMKKNMEIKMERERPVAPPKPQTYTITKSTPESMVVTEGKTKQNAVLSPAPVQPQRYYSSLAQKVDPLAKPAPQTVEVEQALKNTVEKGTESNFQKPVQPQRYHSSLAQKVDPLVKPAPRTVEIEETLKSTVEKRKERDSISQGSVKNQINGWETFFKSSDKQNRERKIKEPRSIHVQPKTPRRGA